MREEEVKVGARTFWLIQNLDGHDRTWRFHIRENGQIIRRNIADVSDEMEYDAKAQGSPSPCAAVFQHLKLELLAGRLP